MISSEKINRVHEMGEYMKYVPFDVSKDDLYNVRSLYDGYVVGTPETFADSYDQVVYNHYTKTGKEAFSALESLARSLHDFNMRRCVKEFMTSRNPRKVVGVMGGHGLVRTEEMYRKIVIISKRLTERGFTMVSGGGPGAMEATHLGAWMAGRSDEDVDRAIAILAVAPKFDDERWLDTAIRVMLEFPQTE